MNKQDKDALEFAVDLLEKPNLAIKIANKTGYPVEYLIKQLPKDANKTISEAANTGVHKALELLLTTLGSYDPESGKEPPESSDLWHMTGSAMSGALGGFFGLWGLTFEIPLTTGIMMRSIAEIAQSEGANMNLVKTQIECVQVLGLGGQSTDFAGASTFYFTTRDAMESRVNEGAEALDVKDPLYKINYSKDLAASAIEKLIEAITTRFSIQVSEKAAAQIFPIIGAATGTAVNTLFIDHFQNIARGHFIIRRLENKYGFDQVRQDYQTIKVRMEQ